MERVVKRQDRCKSAKKGSYLERAATVTHPRNENIISSINSRNAAISLIYRATVEMGCSRGGEEGRRTRAGQPHL